MDAMSDVDSMSAMSPPVELEVTLTGELGLLKAYLDAQFEKQSLLLEGFLGGAARYSSQTDEDDKPHTANVHFEPELTEHQPRLPSKHSAASGFTRRGSSSSIQSGRKSFVRRQEREQHTQAMMASARMTYARSRRSREMDDLVGLRGRVRRLVQSAWFSNFIMLLIVSNAILLGVEIDFSARVGQADIPSAFGTVNAVLVCVFVAETALKLFAFGCHEFWRGGDSVWNIFDFSIVSLSVAETLIDWWAQTMSSSADGSNSFRVMRALRLARTLRGMRIIRLFRYFSALRGLILSIFSTMGSLLWTLLLLGILFYTFSCIFAQVVTDHCRFGTIDKTGDVNSVPDCNLFDEGLTIYWSNVQNGMLTLFMSITGGINWYDAYEPLREVSELALALMNLYIVIGFFTILNVVTGVFVNTAIESAGADKDLATLRQMQKRLENTESLQEVFQEIDEFNTNVVSLSDLEDALSENKLGNFMESLGISTDDVWSLFMLIDVDRNGVVDLDEFVSGCMQLRGPAKSLQVAKMSYENKLTRQAIQSVHEELDKLTRLVRSSARYRLVRTHV